MLRKEEFVKTHPGVREGMTAYNVEGERLGVIEAIDDEGITIEEGRIFHKDVHVPYDDIEDVRQDDVFIRRGREGVEEKRTKEPMETRAEEPRETRESPESRESGGSGEAGHRGEYTGPEEEMRMGEHRRGEEEARTEEQEVSGEVHQERVKVERTEPSQKK